MKELSETGGFDAHDSSLDKLNQFMALQTFEDDSDAATPDPNQAQKDPAILAQEFLDVKTGVVSREVEAGVRQGELTREGLDQKEEAKVELTEKDVRQREVFNSKMFQAVLRQILGGET